ncbi:adaptin N terminal region-domain-containing protein [Protomyces lactucae-debilis]|uniref:Coatomer subunit beta n=1 Tax=Protomyces lactucae-debilis TaxID=2754530 RepID=A0A1Y2EWB8_PROLT|nr:adaptin N terminal region-domain-containing protein [Protomyces lactucae-debilis]ORY75426.1 adaptin N terminal region-domain-containing protein [Protomyces lactucae-debilis]
MSSWTLIAQPASAESPSVEQLKTALENKSDAVKVDTMKIILTLMYNGESLPGVLMHVIRFVMPCKSKALKKLLYLYWEVCPKLNPDGKLKQEYILVINAIRNDLQHPNEYVRGVVSRFLNKLKEPELLEPLVPTCRQNLEHRQAYVRKNAVFAVYSIYSHSEHLIPDAPELLFNFLVAESDATCKRNAFVALTLLDHDKASEYVVDNYASILSMDELMQLAIIDFIRKDASLNPESKSQYLKLVSELLEVQTSTVVYEAATSLTALTTNPAAIQASASKFIELILKESDNNAKLIMLDKVDALRKQNDGVLGDFVMECLRVLSTPDLEVRRKALTLAMDMTSSRNVEEVVTMLKKELTKSMEQAYEKKDEYRQLLISAVHTCAIKFPKVASSVVYLLMDFISEVNVVTATDIINFIKEVVQKFPELRQSIIERLLLTLAELKAARVYRAALWVIGEYCDTEADIRAAWKQIRASIGEVPMLAAEQRLLDKQGAPEEASTDLVTGTSSKPRVLADGTYATESAMTDAAKDARLEAVKASAKPPMRELLLEGEYFLGAVLSATLAKLVMRYAEISSDQERTNALRAEAMLIMASIIRVGQSPFSKSPIDEDSMDRILACLKSLTDFQQEKEIEGAFLQDSKDAFTAIVGVEDSRRAKRTEADKAKDTVQPDDVILFRQLAHKGGAALDALDADIMQAAGHDIALEDVNSKLNKVVQLTGYSDPIYVEAYVTVHQFDIVLDVLLVNQTDETLQNLSVEFATLGDLKVVERPISQSLGAHAFASVQSTIKVSSVDMGVIFGNCVYDDPKTKESVVVILNDMKTDVKNYIQPGFITDAAFRTMWTAFEWENKVTITENTMAEAHGTLVAFLKALQERTNMACLTPEAGLEGDCGFLSVNLYAKSVFGEDALANLSIEKHGDEPIQGHIRIRAKSQGIALSVGELINKNKDRLM